MSIKITPYQIDSTKFQADVSYKIGKKVYRKRWLIPDSIYIGLPEYKKEKACLKWAENKLIETVKTEETPNKLTLTFDQFYLKWLEWLGQQVKPTTVDNYDRAYKNHIKPFWGKRLLNDLSDAQLVVNFKTQIMNKTRLKNGSKGKNVTIDYKGKNKLLSVSSTNNIQACLSSIAEFAHDCRLIDYKPKIKFEPREQNDIVEKKYSMKQQETILEAAKMVSNEMYAAILLGLDCGLRRGEVCALSWDRVFPEKNYIDIKYNLNVIRGVTKIGSTKGGKKAEVAMSSRVNLALSSIRPQNAEGRVFVDLMPWKLNALVHKVLTIANKMDKTITISANFHRFRHNCASNLADADFYVVKIKDHLRHASLDVTMRYIHTGSIDETRQALDLIGKPGKKEKLKLVK